MDSCGNNLIGYIWSDADMKVLKNIAKCIGVFLVGAAIGAVFTLAFFRLQQILRWIVL